jgi:hypothetical protein
MTYPSAIQIIARLGLVLWLGMSVARAESTVEIDSGNKIQGFTGFVEDYERCKARQEFTPIERLRQGCDAYRVYDRVTVTVPVRLSYNVDDTRFEFQLPVLREFDVKYTAIVEDDFPAALAELPRDEWHVDEPTPRASVYKECPLRAVDVDRRMFDQVEPYRPGSWRGCTTYYDRDAAVGWRRVEGIFSANDVAFYAYTDVDTARSIKEVEKDLSYVIQGRLNIPEKTLEVSQVELRNLATGDVLLRLAP